MSIGDHSKLLGVVAIVCIAPVPYVVCSYCRYSCIRGKYLYLL